MARRDYPCAPTEPCSDWPGAAIPPPGAPAMLLPEGEPPPQYLVADDALLGLERRAYRDGWWWGLACGAIATGVGGLLLVAAYSAWLAAR